MVADIEVTRTSHGPFERISLTSTTGGRQFQLSVYRLGDLLIDAGGTRVAAALAAALDAAPPRRIVLTHHHEDHAGGVGELRRAFGSIPVHAPRPHVAYLQAEHELLPYRVFAWGTPEPVADAVPYDPGAIFEVAGVTLEALATPGHTPGHVAFVASVDGARFSLTGDLYVGARPLAGWYESAADDIVRSCRTLAASPTVLLPTHGRVREDGERALADVADVIEAEGDRITGIANRIGTRDPALVATEAFGPESGFARLTAGEFSHAAFVRSVLDPVRALPAQPIRLR